MAAASCHLLDVFPPEMQFPFERDHQNSCFLRLSNRTIHTVAFKVKTTCPTKYSVKPNIGVVFPRSSCTVKVTMGALRVPYLELRNRDKFLVECMAVSDGSSAKDITSQMFVKEKKGRTIGEVKLNVYVLPPPEITEGHISLVPRPTQRIMDNGGSTSDLSSGSVSLGSAYKLGTVVGTPVGQIVQLPPLAALASKLTEEVNFALEQNRKLLYELELLKREVRRWAHLLVVGLLVIILGYLIQN